MHSDALGIMVCESSGLVPFHDKIFYQHLCLIGRKLKIQVYVFSPTHINWNLQRVHGFTMDVQSGQWIERDFPLPRLIYDRCFYKSKAQMKQYHFHISQLKRMNHVLFLGNKLNGKWAIQQVLMQDSEIQPFLPYSEEFTHIHSLTRWINDKNEAFLKPQAGSQGRGVLHITKQTLHRYTVKGRDRSNRPIELTFEDWLRCCRWIRYFIGRRKYLIQDYLNLTAASGMAYDIRSLMQKNHKGRWQLTGMAVRVGAPGSITSNIHGGGTSRDVSPFLLNEFGEDKAIQIQSTIAACSGRISPYLEQYYGRLIELGIDFGIDRQGQVWLLEVNSKPGRTVFSNLHNKRQSQSSIHNPIHYARYILDRQLGG